jgi:error-prone DNA polymerase
MTDATQELHRLSDDLLSAPLARADHVNSPLPSQAIHPRDLIDQLPGTRGHPRNARIIPKSRDFH